MNQETTFRIEIPENQENRKKTTGWKIFKFCTYGSIGMVGEVLFSNLFRLFSRVSFMRPLISEFITMTFPPGVPDNQTFPLLPMYAMTSFWLFFVYATGFQVIEWCYIKFIEKGLNFFVRTGAYALIIFFVEFLWGWFYHFLLGTFLWRYDSLFITTSFKILPHWYLASMLAELVIKQLVTKEPRNQEKDDNEFKVSSIKDYYEHIKPEYTEYYN